MGVYLEKGDGLAEKPAGLCIRWKQAIIYRRGVGEAAAGTFSEAGQIQHRGTFV